MNPGRWILRVIFEGWKGLCSGNMLGIQPRLGFDFMGYQSGDRASCSVRLEAGVCASGSAAEAVDSCLAVESYKMFEFKKKWKDAICPTLRSRT
jgi:hypothetical protein